MIQPQTCLRVADNSGAKINAFEFLEVIVMVMSGT